MSDVEKAPLLAGSTNAAKEPRQFKGPWYHLFGDCGGHDVAACCLAVNAPHVAFGWNGARAMGLTWYKEAFKLFLLTCGAFALVRVIFCVMLMVNCTPAEPQTMGDNALAGATWTSTSNVDEHWHHDKASHSWHHHHHGHNDHDDIFGNMSKDEIDACIMRTVLTPYSALLMAFAVACVVYASYFAALRRKNIRERFGIEGTFRSDWLLWLLCAPCAITQETRTLMHNHVEEGLWHGPLQAPAQPAAMSG